VATKFPAPYRASRLRGSGRLGRRALALTALTSVAALALAACSSSSSSSSSSTSSAPAASSAAASSSGPSVMTTPASASQTMSETGSSLMAPLFALWGPAYHSQFSQVTLSTASSSSGVGISSAAAGTVNIGASDAYLSPADMAKYTTLENIPLAVAALMVVYNVPGVKASTNLKLNGTVLAKIFSGKITKWNDPAITALNPGVTLPSATIVLVHRADSSGSTFLFTSYMDAQDPTDWSSSLIGTTVAWPKQPGEIGATGSGGIVSSVKSTPDSISYVGVSYLSKVTAAGEGEAAVGNSSGSFLLPNTSTIDAALAGFTTTPANEAISLINGAGAQAYPIINYEYAIVNTSQSSATLAQDMQAFLYWAVTSGTTQLASVNFQPLPASVVTLSEAQIAKIQG
jgi:phosphate transport system substrate-binding protein